MLDSAVEVFAELGYVGASIGEICKRAGYTTGAFYSNWSTKDALFYELFDAHADRAIQRIAARLESISTSQVTIEQLAQKFAEVESEAEERTWFLISTEFTLYAIRNPEAAQVLADHDAKVRRMLTPLLKTALDMALGDRGKDVDLDGFARLVIALREGALMQSFVEPVNLPPGTLERSYLPTLARVLATSPGVAP